MPVAWSQGFSPHPLLSFGLGLPTGCESLAEYLDIRVTGPFQWADEVPDRLTELLPDGMFVLAATVLSVPPDSLQQAVTSCSWDLEVDGVPEAELGARIRGVLAAPQLVVTRVRKGVTRSEDIRPQIMHLELWAGPGPEVRDQAPGVAVTHAVTPLVVAELATQPRGVRPSELVQGLGADLVLVRARRTQQWIERDGARSEPLSPDGQATWDLARDRSAHAT